MQQYACEPFLADPDWNVSSVFPFFRLGIVHNWGWLHLAYVLHKTFLSSAGGKTYSVSYNPKDSDCRQMHQFSNGNMTVTRR